MKEELLTFVRKYKVRILCAFLGLVTGILMLTLGFWRTILLVLLSCIGYLVGYRIDAREEFDQKILGAAARIKRLIQQ